jgi:cupin 2 domain-containing protein
MFQELVTTADGQSVPRFAAANPPEQHSVGSGSEAINRGNLLGKIPQALPEELMQTLLVADGVRLERIVSHGHASPEGFWYDQPDDEWILILHGAARLQFADGDITLQPGDYLNIPAHRKHRVAWTSPDEPTVWLAVWYTAHQASRD